MDSNLRVKDDIMRRLDENKKQSDKMHHDLGRRANSHERRSLMELEYRVLQVELEKLELERSTMLQEMVVKQKNQILDEARQQLRLRDMIIDAQRQLLLEHNIQMGPKLTRMFERLVPMEAFWGTQRYDSMNGSSSSDTAEGNQGKNAQTSFIAQVASELKKAGRPGDDWGMSEAVFPESKLKNIETVTYNPTVSIKPNRDYQSEIQTMPAQIHSKSPRASRNGNPRNHSTAISKKVQRVAAKVRRSKSSAYVNEHNAIQKRLETERKRRRQKRRQRYKERNNSENIVERDEDTENSENNEDKRDNSRIRERKKAKALQKRVLSASGKQWADRLKMYLVTPRKKRANNSVSNNIRASSTKKHNFNKNGSTAPGTTSPRSRKPSDSKIPYSSSKHHSQQQQGIAKTKSSKTSIAQSVAQRIANAIKGPSSKGNTFNIASPQQTPAPPPPPKKDASLKSNRSPEDENKKADYFDSKPKIQRTPPKVNKNLTHEFQASTKMEDSPPHSKQKNNSKSANSNGNSKDQYQNDENQYFGPILQAGTPLPHIKPKGRWSPVNSPERKGHGKSANTNQSTESTTANNTERHRGGRRGRRRGDKKGIRPVLHRLNAKLRNRNRHGRDKSKNRDDNNRENNKYDGAMSELPTITNLTLDI